MALNIHHGINNVNREINIINIIINYIDIWVCLIYNVDNPAAICSILEVVPFISICKNLEYTDICAAKKIKLWSCDIMIPKNLAEFLNDGVSDIIETLLYRAVRNPKELRFLKGYASSASIAAKRRSATEEKEGVNVPVFLICSIASRCNLRCSGCYARAGGMCCDEKEQEADMNAGQWARIFDEASEIGVSFILLAGGEPLMRKDILELAAKYSNIVFPIFTNGTLIDEGYLDFFDSHRNMLPVISIEGSPEQTDDRRGSGVSEKIKAAMKGLRQRGILFGMSVTVTRENMEHVTGREYVSLLREQGCGVLFYIEYVPAEPGTEHLVLLEDDLLMLEERIGALAKDKDNKGMAILSFPGDEKNMGGCLAAGRGFFHINPVGNAEPCPFSPFSEMNLKQNSLKDVLKSGFFMKVRDISAKYSQHHEGGCTLFEHRDEVFEAMEGSPQ